ncbi:calumenin-B-like isoform X1 [Ruditapes philippinarum]|uniref:calumenin-B-like isoform X1 n=1 Tax=Ruditapes philippinarum TaxID=129788 RepID=UPI00295A56FC|nr:calumenin-B-like isoform X1 [Ruditapes philippinarum]
MKLYTASLALALLSSSLSSALPPKEHKERVHEQKLSDQDHEKEGEHNNDYDHDAFLGQKEARDFDQLTPEESKEKLGIIVDKIDRNHDGVVTEDELQHWIQYVQKKYVIEDTDRMWKEHKLDDAGLSWESYRKNTYGYEYDPEEAEDFSEMVNRDTRKFKQADENGDGYLSKEEFASFLHPEEHEHMKDIVVLETMEDIDKDKDGKISLDEYIADIYNEEDDDDDDDDDDEEDSDKDGVPDWVESEKDQFKNFRDKNMDGYLNLEEVRAWVIPEDYDNSKEETKHLFRESDVDRDGVLTKQEILDKYDIFVGSQATDFGDALTRHDEF